MNTKKRFVVGTDFTLGVGKKTSTAQKPARNFLIEKYINVGYYLIVPLLLGVFVGLWLDRLFKTKPILTSTFILLGAIGVFYNLWRITKRNF